MLAFGVVGALNGAALALVRFRALLPLPLEMLPSRTVAAALNAVAEELQFRSVILGLMLVGGLNPGLAVALQAVLFGAAHRRVWRERDWYFVIGSVILGYACGLVTINTEIGHPGHGRPLRGHDGHLRLRRRPPEDAAHLGFRGRGPARRRTLGAVTPCPNCGRPNADDARFCSNCGHALVTRVGIRGAPPRHRPVRGPGGVHLALGPARPRGRARRRVPFFERSIDEIRRFGGTAEQFRGDAIMALFGLQQAHEDDPERAVRAAFAVRDGLAALAPDAAAAPRHRPPAPDRDRGRRGGGRRPVRRLDDGHRRRAEPRGPAGGARGARRDRGRPGRPRRHRARHRLRGGRNARDPGKGGAGRDLARRWPGRGAGLAPRPARPLGAAHRS